MQAKSQDPRERSKAHGKHEDQGPDDVGDGPEEIEQRPGHHVKADPRDPDRPSRLVHFEEHTGEDQIAAGEEHQGQGDRHREQRPHEGDGEGLQRPVRDLAEEIGRKVGGKQPLDICEHLGAAVRTQQADQIESRPVPAPEDQRQDARRHQEGGGSHAAPGRQRQDCCCGSGLTSHLRRSPCAPGRSGSPRPRRAGRGSGSASRPRGS